MASLTTQTAAAAAPRRSALPGIVPRVGRLLSAVAPGAAAMLLEYFFTRTRRTRLPDYEKAWLLQAAARPVTLSSGIQVPLYEWRATPRRPGVLDEAPLPTVLLVHGFSGRAGQMGGLAAALVRAGFRAVAFDAPGHGAAAGSRSSLPEMVQAVEDVAAHLGPLHGIAAHSLGAASSVVAMARGLRVRRAALISPPGDARVFLAGAGRQLGLPPDVISAAQVRIEQRFGVSLEALRSSRLAPGLAQPALILHDSADRIVPVAHGQGLADNWPGAEMQITAGLGHSRILRDPGVAAAVTAHLAQEIPAAAPS